MIEFLKTNAVLLALVAVILYQQSELKEVERTLNYIYAAVQTNNNDIQMTREEVWAVSDLIVAVYEEETAAAE
ncbi:MAG: hypothetical protein GYB45_10485 [Gammaproteobacteria bacterium]|nr:hypothetical protein [Gammaproteobacteria bacterium]